MKTRLITAIGAAATALVVPLVMRYEGTVPKTYRDPVGILTACTGHTGPELRMGQTFTRQQCEAMLFADLEKHASALACIHQPLTDGQTAGAQRCQGVTTQSRQAVAAQGRQCSAAQGPRCAQRARTATPCTGRRRQVEVQAAPTRLAFALGYTVP